MVGHAQMPLAHLPTQYNREISRPAVDMNFANSSQSAHGDREFGFIGSSLPQERKVMG
jgi:L-arabinose isomerase